MNLCWCYRRLDVVIMITHNTQSQDAHSKQIQRGNTELFTHTQVVVAWRYMVECTPFNVM